MIRIIVVNKITPALTINLNPQAANLINSLLSNSAISLNDKVLYNIRLFDELGIPIFYSNHKSLNQPRAVTVLPNQVNLSLQINQVDERLELYPALQLPESSGKLSQMVILGSGNGWALSEDYLFQLSESINPDTFRRFPLNIQEKDVDHFREKYLDQITRSYEITGIFGKDT